MGLFDSLSSGLSAVGNFISGNANWLLPAATIGGGLYMANRQERARQNQLDEYNRALAANANAEPQITPGLMPGAAEEAMAMLQEQYAAALEMMAPFVETSKRVLPKMEKAYGKGLGHLDSAAGLTLTPQMFQRAMNSSIPAYTVPLAIPEYLRGGK